MSGDSVMGNLDFEQGTHEQELVLDRSSKRGGADDVTVPGQVFQPFAQPAELQRAQVAAAGLETVCNLRQSVRVAGACRRRQALELLWCVAQKESNHLVEDSRLVGALQLAD